MKEPMISAIMPVYNSEKYLKQAIESVISQSYTNLELIIINDGSTDNSEAICQEYAGRDGRVKLISQDNSGSQVARNIGLKAASGDIISFVDADDILNPKMYQILVANMNVYDADVSACGICTDEAELENNDLYYTSGVITGEADIMASVIGGKTDINRVHGYLWNKIYKKKFLQSNFFNEDINIGEDGLFNIILLKNARAVAYTNRKLYFYRQSGGSLTKTHMRPYSLWKKEVKAYTDMLESNEYDKVQYYCKQMLIFCYLKKEEAIVREHKDLKEIYSDKLYLQQLEGINLGNRNASMMYWTLIHCIPVFIAYKYLYLHLKHLM